MKPRTALLALGGGLAAAGAFLVGAQRRRGGGLAGMPPRWWDRPAPRARRLCYRTKTAALNAFREANRDVIEDYGGESLRVGPSEFDAVNHKHGARARTIAEALEAALPVRGRPYCLTDIDLEALNDTSPARDHPLAFRLPDWAEERRLMAQQMDLWRQEAEDAGMEVPSSDCCRVCWNSQPCGNGCIPRGATCRAEPGCAGDDVSCPVGVG